MLYTSVLLSLFSLESYPIYRDKGMCSSTHLVVDAGTIVEKDDVNI